MWGNYSSLERKVSIGLRSGRIITKNVTSPFQRQFLLLVCCVTCVQEDETISELFPLLVFRCWVPLKLRQTTSMRFSARPPKGCVKHISHTNSLRNLRHFIIKVCFILLSWSGYYSVQDDLISFLLNVSKFVQLESMNKLEVDRNKANEPYLILLTLTRVAYVWVSWDICCY